MKKKTCLTTHSKNLDNGASIAILDNINQTVFFEQYWQKKPLIVRNALPQIEQLLDANELAGLALEDDVVSRLIVQHPNKDDPFKDKWDVQHGPFDASIFSTLGESHWSLLVQHVDQLIPEVNRLLNHFDFLPSWRLDDIMISYATDKGGVGPHFDYYDVFLIQASGRRRWRLGQFCSDDTPLQTDTPMRLLTHFEQTNEYVVEPGDLLYIPPNCAHWGEAMGESITYSVGFRAPSHQDILLDYTQELTANLANDLRYTDNTTKLPQENPTEITSLALNQLKNIIAQHTDNNEALASWFGQTMTQPNPGYINDDFDLISEDALVQGTAFKLHDFAKTAFFNTDKDALLFVDGTAHKIQVNFAQALSNKQPMSFTQLSKKEQSLVMHFFEQSLLIAAEV